VGELPIRNELDAKKIQVLMITVKEIDIMLVTVDRPDFIPEAEFKSCFGGTEGEPYRQMMGKIEHRVASLQINRI
jgi:hypothetical protein